MPSPIGHALGGALFGGVVSAWPARQKARRAPWWRNALVLAAVGLLADLDFLVGLHSRYTHSVGAAVAAGVVAWLVTGRRLGWATAVAAAYGSHAVLDWLGSDTVAPIGILALWPFSDAFYQADRPLFMAVARDVGRSGFWAHNARAAAWEVLLLGPATAALWWRLARGRPGSSCQAGFGEALESLPDRQDEAKV